MSKEYLEAFNRLNTEDDTEYVFKRATKNIEIVESALQRLEQIDNSNPSEALEYIENKLKDLEYVAKQNDNEYLLSKYIPSEKFDIIKQALQRLNKYEQILSKGRLTDRNYKNTTLDLDSCKPYLRLGKLEDIYEEGKHNE
ncbi:MAG: hypothetical protein IKP07_03670 [Bacilli bacterium]|nr:hypothetical protein [Bacilli bacterium]